MTRSEQPLFTFFYEVVLGLTLLEDTPFAIVFKVPGGTLRLAKTPDFTPQPFSLVGWVVPDIEADMANLARKGVSFEIFPGLPQEASGIWTVPDGTRVCWFRDPDGNLLSLTQQAG